MRKSRIFRNYGSLYSYRGVCPYCGSKVNLVGRSFIFKNSDQGFMYACSNYPECDAYVSCHKGTTKPKGTISNSDLRHYRISAHRALDSIWKSGLMSRNETYEWLSYYLDIDREDCHVAMFNEDLCKETVYLATNYCATHQ